MAQLILDDLLHTLNQLWVTHGGDIPVIMAYPTFGPVLPAWAAETGFRPVVEVCVSDEAEGSPAVLLVGLGTGREETTLTLDLDPAVLVQRGAHGPQEARTPFCRCMDCLDLEILDEADRLRDAEEVSHGA